MSASIGTSFSFMRATTVNMETGSGSGCDIHPLSVIDLDWQHYMCSDHKVTVVRDTNSVTDFVSRFTTDTI